MNAYDLVCRRLLEVTRHPVRNRSARCPAHDDTNPSLSVSPGTGQALVHCHVGCRTEDVMAALDLPMSALFDTPRSNGSDITTTYDYVDEQGTPLFQVVRKVGKKFVQRRPDGNGGWIYKLGNTRRVLYRLPELIAGINAGHTPYIVEGEKDVDRARADGHIATTNPGGAGKWRPEYNETFRGADVVIVADKDEPGYDHARHIANQLDGIAASIRIVQAAVGQDLSDHLTAGHTLDDLEPIDEATPAADRVELADCVATFQRWLHLPDPGIVVATLGAAAANLIAGDPLWLLIVGPPSSAKTECVSALTPLPYVHPAAKVTEASLLSGTPPREHVKAAKGGLLRQIGDFGIMLVKDFTSVLAQNRDTRAEALAAVREVFDGRWDRPVGTGGGIVLSWSGKCGLIGGCTPTIDRHHAVMGTLGERFLFYRVNVDDPDDQASRRLGSRRHETDMRRELAGAVAGVLAGVDTNADIATDPDEDRWLVSLAVWTAKARTPVERDGYSREVVVMPESEGPARIVTQLGAMRDGLVAIGAPLHERWATLHKLAWDAMPAMRREVLQALQHADGWLKRAELMDATDIPRTPIERELEDLVLVGLADRQKAGDANNDPWQYQLSKEAHRLWPKAAPKRTTPPSDDASGPSSKERSTGSSTSRGSFTVDGMCMDCGAPTPQGVDLCPDDYARRMNPGTLGPVDPDDPDPWF